MSMLARAVAPRAVKAIDQQEMSTVYGGVQYVPLENHQTWTSDLANAAGGGLGIVTVYACVRLLAETIASVPMILYRRVGQGKERATDHPLYPVFHDQPNPDMTSLVWRELLVSHVAGWGNHFSEVARGPLGDLELWPVRPDRIEAVWDSDGRKQYDYLSPSGGRKRMKPGSIFHVPGLSPDGLRGYSPIALHRKALRLYSVAQEYGTNFLENGARPAVVMTHPGNLSTAAIGRLAAQMDDVRGARNAGKTVILEEGLAITEIGVPPEDAQYIETRKFQMQEIARMYRVPPHMIGDLERATFSNIEHQSIDFVVHTIRPWLVRIEQEIKAQLLADEPDLSVEFLVDGLLRGDAESRAKALQIQRNSGVINGDEWRAIENLNPIPDGSGQTYWMPVNYAAAVVVDEDAEDEIELTSPPLLTRIKAMGEFTCPDCGKLINRRAAPGTVGYCRGCKAEKTFGEEPEPEPPDPLKTATIAFLSREQAPPEVHFHEGAFKSDNVPAPVVNVPAPVVNVPAPVVNVAAPDTEVFTDAMLEVRAVLAQMSKPKTIVRDKDGRIVGLS